MNKSILKMRFLGFTLMAILATLVACNPKSQYELLVEEEMATGVRNDSLFLGLSLGMSQKDFYGKCWELNKQGLIRQGDANQSVLYETQDELPHPARLNFYPTFAEGGDRKVISMPCVFAYTNWAPWNKYLFGDSLAVDLQEMFLDWYGGNDFITIPHPRKGTAYVKVDGNRQITMIARDELVKVLIKDLTAEPNAQKPETESAEEIDPDKSAAQAPREPS
jgi:hypothetical protein